jgi:hypothetical protein
MEIVSPLTEGLQAIHHAPIITVGRRGQYHEKYPGIEDNQTISYLSARCREDKCHLRTDGYCTISS